MRKAFDIVSHTAGQMDDAFRTVRHTLEGLGAGLSLGVFAESIKASIDFADKLNDLAKSTGVTVETLGGLGYAAKQSGVDLDTVAKGLQKLAQNMAAAASGGNDQLLDLF